MYISIVLNRSFENITRQEFNVKASLSSGFVLFSHSSFVCMCHNYPDNLAFRTTGIEGAHLTLLAIPFQVGVNYSSNFSLLQTYKKKLAEFPFL